MVSLQCVHSCEVEVVGKEGSHPLGPPIIFIRVEDPDKSILYTILKVISV